MSETSSQLDFVFPTEQGRFIHRSPEQARPYRVHYHDGENRLYLGDSVAWLGSLAPGSVDLIVADPPYNMKKAAWDDFASQQAYIEWSLNWIAPASRTLARHGSLYICGLSEVLADLKHPASRHFASCRWLVWNYRNKANLGRDWGRSHESILHFRKSSDFRLRQDDVRVPYGRHTLKYPSHPQAESSNFGNGRLRDDWQPHPLGAKPKDVLEIPTTCNGMGEKTPHPTQKPEELVRKLVLAASDARQVVVDPFSGSGTTAVVAEQLGRRWLACDQSEQYNLWTVERLHRVRRMSVAQWIEHDRENARRRESIR